MLYIIIYMPICSVYSNEEKDKTGNGTIVKYISVNQIKDGITLSDIKTKLRNEQKIENDKYLYHKEKKK